MTKKEAAKLTEEMTKLQGTLGGMRKMKRLPGAIFIVDPHRERIGVTEANKLEIPVVGTGDTNVDPDELDFIIPANDDAIRAIRLLCTLVADAAIEGASERSARSATEPEQIEAMAMPEAEDEVARRDRRARRRPRRWRRAVVRARCRRRRPAARRPRRPCRGRRRRGAARGDARGDRRRARPRGGREGRGRPPGRTAGRLTRRPARAGRAPDTNPPRTPGGARSGPPREQENEQAWRTSRRSWSRSCANGPAPASWTASAP